MLLTNQDISQPSLCHPSLGSSMVRASHRRSEICGFDSCLGLRNIFWVCKSLSSQNGFPFPIMLQIFLVPYFSCIKFNSKIVSVISELNTSSCVRSSECINCSVCMWMHCVCV